MTCKEVVGQLDLPESPRGFRPAVRHALHLSFCEACRNYRKLSVALRKALRVYANNNPPASDLERLNQDLLRKYKRP